MQTCFFIKVFIVGTRRIMVKPTPVSSVTVSNVTVSSVTVSSVTVSSVTVSSVTVSSLTGKQILRPVRTTLYIHTANCTLQ